MTRLLPLLGLLVLALVLRVPLLAEQSIWLDEATSFFIAEKSLSDIIRGIGFDRHTPPAYYLILHFWLQIFGSTAVTLRSMSVVIDLCNMLLFWGLARRTFSDRAALFGTLLYALSPFLILYSQEGRMYTLLLFEVLLSSVLFLRARGRSLQYSELALLFLTAVLGMYTHYYYALFFFAFSVAVFFDDRFSSRRSLQVLGLGIAVLCAFIPWIGVIVGLVESGGQTHRQFSTLMIPYAFLRFVVGYGIMPLSYGTKDDPLQTLLDHAWVLSGPLLLFGLLLLFATYRLIVQEGRNAAYILFPLLLPGLIAMLISLKVPMLSERYLIVSYPYFLLLLVYGLLHLYWSEMGLALCGLVFAYGFLQQASNPLFGNTNWRAANSFTAAQDPLAAITVIPHFADDSIRRNTDRSVDIFRIDGEDQQLESLALPERFWLYERADMESYRPRLEKLGYGILQETFFPRGHGLRIFLLERQPAAQATAAEPEPQQPQE